MLKRLDERTRSSFAAARFLSVNQISIVLGGLGLVLILVACGFIVWKERATALTEASEHAEGRAFFLADHAARLFEVSDLALRATAGALGDFDWETLAKSRSLWNEMRATNAALPYVDNLWLNDASGQLRSTTFAFPAPASDAADREIFQAVRKSAGEIVIGEPIVGRVIDSFTFLVGRRLEWADGSFRGMISATADVDYFRKYWKQLDLPNEEHLALVRAAGTVLLRHPPASGDPYEPSDTALAAAAANHPLSGSYAPAPGQTGFYHRVGNLPLYMAVIYRDGAVTQAWLAWLWRFLPFPCAALAALFGIMVLNHRQSISEAHATAEIERGRMELSHANQRLEERVAERTSDLRESNDEIQRFAYIVSHDLRAPLVNIMGFTSELQRVRAELFLEPPAAESAAHRLKGAGIRSIELRQDFDEAIGFIQLSIEKMDRLIRAILLLSRQGQRTFQAERIDMNIVMQSIVDGFAHRIQSMGTTVTIGALPALTSDRIAIEQVFSNLIDNALKYLRPAVPGRIGITATLSSNKAILRISDNGRGIDPKDRGRVFDLFRRAGVQDQPGDGIGLAHVRSLVRRLGGSIALDSRLGQGCTFTVVLPLVLDGSVR